MLAYRAQRRLRCYDGDSKQVLRTFCRQRRLANSLQGANKPALIEALEDADEKATFDRFLDLPPELRVAIYRLHYEDFDLRDNCTDGIVSHNELTYPSAPAITQVCSLVRRESLPIFYQVPTFVFLLMTRPRTAAEPPKPRRTAGTRFIKSLSADAIATMRFITFRGYFTSAKHGRVGEKTEMTIDMGAGRVDPKVVDYQRPKTSSGRKGKSKGKLERKLKRRASEFVRNLAGRPNDQRLLKSDFKALHTMFKKYGGNVYKR